MRTPVASSNNTGAHGLGTGLAAQRLPVTPRERKPALAALAVLLILGGALVSAYLVIDSGQRVSAIEIAEPVAAGELIPETALREVQIGKTGIDYVAWDQRRQVTQNYAAVSLVPGSLLTANMAAELKDVFKGRIIVGLALKPAQAPAEPLRRGATVALYAVGGRGDSTYKPGVLIAPDALVYAVPLPRTSRTSSGGDTRISVAVLPEQAALLTQAASVSAVVVTLVPPGTTVPLQKTPTIPSKTTTPSTKPGG